MSRFFVLVAGGMLLLVLLAGRSSSDTGAGSVLRGKYLVHHVAMCVECHTPRTREGELDHTRLLQGAPMPVSSPFPNQRWAFRAPAIAGLPGWSGRDATRLLEIGRRPSGRPPLPPMPRFHMNHEDARAVVSYLLSLR